MAGPNMDQFEAYFQRADLDKDGRISGPEAVAFFQATNLPQPVLARIWMHADHSKAGWLGRQEFYNALKLVTVAQSKRELTPELVKVVLHGPASAKIPAPQINLAALQAPQPNLKTHSPTPVPPQIAPVQRPQNFAPQQTQNMRPPRPAPTISALQSQQTPQPRPQATTMLTQPLPLKPNDATPSNQVAAKDSKALAVKANGFSSDLLFSNVLSATSSQPVHGLLEHKSLTSSVSVSSADATISARPQPTAKASLVDPSPNSFIQHQRSQGGVNPSQQMQSSVPWPKMAQSDVQKYSKVFFQVDTDRDGKITGEQAKNLFLSWKLPREILKQVWDLSDQDNDSMLSLREFCVALYLMERSREGRSLPSVLPPGILDEALLSTSGPPAVDYGNNSWKPGLQQRVRKPPRPPQLEEPTPPSQPKPKVPVLEKNLVDQLSTEEQNALNSKFQEAIDAEKKVAELEKEIKDAKEKVQFYHAKMQEIILYKSRCDNRLNEITARVSADKQEAELLAKKYEEKYKQAGDVASKLTIEEATFRDIQEKKMELYRAIVKLDQESNADKIREHANHIQLDLEGQVKALNERCKSYGLRGKPTSLVELPFGWQLGIQEGAADWDEDWDKFEDEGFTHVKELTVDTQTVIAPPKPKTSIREKAASSTYDSKAKEPTSTDGVEAGKIPDDDSSNVHGDDAEKRLSDGVTSPGEEHEAGSPPDSPGRSNAVESSSDVFQDSHSKKDANFDGSPHDTQSENQSAKYLLPGDKTFDEPDWGTFSRDSAWDFDSTSIKDEDTGKLGENSFFGSDNWVLNPIKTGTTRDTTYQKQNSVFDSVSSTPNTYAKPGPSFDSVPSTPNTYQSPFFDSVPSTPNTYVKQSPFLDSVPSTPNTFVKQSSFFDSVPSTPLYNSTPRGDNMFQQKSPFSFADSVPSTPMNNSGNSRWGFGEGSQEQSFDAFSRFDSFNLHDSGPFDQGDSFKRFDSMRGTRDSDYDQGFSTHEPLSRFDSFRSTADSEYNHGFPAPRDSFSRFDSFRSTADSEYNHGVFPQRDSLARFDSFRSTKDSEYADPFGSSDPFKSSLDPFGSSDPFKSSNGSRSPKKDSDSWKAF